MNWNQVIGLAGQTLHTKNNRKFDVLAVSSNTVTIRIQSSNTEQTISRANLAAAAKLVAGGVKLKGPGDYRAQVADERPAYAWAILHHLTIA